MLITEATEANRRGAYADGVVSAERALNLARDAFGPRHPDTLTSMASLAVLYSSQGRLAEAEALSREALEERRAALGPRHPDTLTSMNNLAHVYSSQGRLAEAEALYKEALEGAREILGPHHPLTLTSMNNLANLYPRQGYYTEAEAFYKEALEGRRETLGRLNPHTLASLNNLASLYERQGRHKEAEALTHESSRAQPQAPITPDQRQLSEVDKELERLISGAVAFSVPERMRVGRTRRMKAVITVQGPFPNFQTEKEEDVKTEVAALRVSKQMSATLNGGNAFDISPSGPQMQWVSYRTPTTWLWGVTSCAGVAAAR